METAKIDFVITWVDGADPIWYKEKLTHEMMHGAVDYTSYEGTELHGKIDLVMQRGNIIAENNEFKGNRGDGEYLYRKPFLGDL